MRTIQFREAVCEAMSEEMRRDDRVFLLGEEVAEYNGAYKASKGMLEEFGPERVIDTPIAELGFSAIAVGSGHERPASHRGVHDLELSQFWPVTKSSTTPAKCCR